MILRIYNNSKNNIFKILLGIVLFVGIFLRFWIFAQDYSPYADEVGLYNNIKNLNFSAAALNLQDLQVAPIAFMLISKIFFLIANAQYSAMKILPLISSILSVPAFYILSKKFLNNKFAVLFANILFALNYSLIFYSQSIKHYSTEVLVTILAFLVFTSIKIDNLDFKKSFILGCLASFALFFSFGFIHIITGFYLCFFFSKTDFVKKVKYSLVSLAPFAITLFVHFVIFKGIYVWQVAEFKCLKYFNPYSYKWFMNYFFLDFHNNFIPVILSITLVLGCLLFLREKKINNFLLLLFPIISAFLSGQLYIYPFFGRLTLFLFPIFFILFAKMLDFFDYKNIPLKIFVSILAIFILFQGKVFLINKKLSYVIGTAKEFHQALSENKIKNGEYLFINDQTYDAFVLYNRDDFDVEEIVTKKNMLIFYHDTINPFEVVIFPKGSIIHLFAARYLWVDESYFDSMNEWVAKSCKILAKKDFKTGTYYKCLNK